LLFKLTNPKDKDFHHIDNTYVIQINRDLHKSCVGGSREAHRLKVIQKLKEANNPLWWVAELFTAPTWEEIEKGTNT